MTIKEVYEKYKHVDYLLVEKYWLEDSRTVPDILYDCWQAIRNACQSTAEEPKPNGCCSGKDTMAGLMVKLAVQIEALSKNIEEMKNKHLPIPGAKYRGTTT